MKRNYPNYYSLQNVELLKFLTVTQKNDVLEILDYKKFKKKEIIYSCNEKSKRLFFVLNGSVKISKYSNEGKEMITNVLKSGGVFGVESIFNNQSDYYSEVAEALEETLFFSLSIKDIRKFIEANFEFGQSVNELIGNAYNKSQKRLEILVFKKAPERIKAFIKQITDEDGKKLFNNEEYIVKTILTHSDISKITSTTRQTVTTTLNKLERDNVLIYDRTSILIKNYHALCS